MSSRSLVDVYGKKIDSCMDAMSMESMVGHLLCPENKNYSVDDWKIILKKIPLGTVFFGPAEKGSLRQTIREVQELSPLPLLVAADLESGAGTTVSGLTPFPAAMALGAVDAPQLAREIGVAMAKEARWCGINWTFGPVCDLSLNFQNAIVNNRALSDKAPHAIRLLVPWIEAMQRNGLAATAKHFPGDGVDDRDQHFVTSVNALPIDQWHEIYGVIWKAVIEAGVMSIMAGHISLPDYQGFQHDPDGALPATLCRKLQVDLLREELGFSGVLISDAAAMMGMTSRVPMDERAVQNIESGSDVFLWANPIEDHAYLMEAVRCGRLTEERVRSSVARVLAMKFALGLFDDRFGPEPTDRESESFRASARTIAERSLTVVRSDGRPPIQLPEKARILTVTLRYENPSRTPLDLDVFDEELARRGHEITHLLNPRYSELQEASGKAAAVFINIYVTQHMKRGTVRLIDNVLFAFWRNIHLTHPNVFFTSFGTPYVLYDLPHIPNLLLAWSGGECEQRAAVNAWLGQIKAEATSPIKFPRIHIKRIPEYE